jgi:hypothetical protein
MASELHAMIRMKIARRELPRRPPAVTWAGRRSAERACDGCERPLAETEFELLFEDGRVVYFHPACHTAWAEVRREFI